MVGHQQQVTYATVWGRDRVSQSLGDVPKWVGHWLELRCASRPWRNWPSREQPMSLRHQPVGETFRRISPDVLVSALPSTIAASPKGSETQQACVSVTAPLKKYWLCGLGRSLPPLPTSVSPLGELALDTQFPRPLWSSLRGSGAFDIPSRVPATLLLHVNSISRLFLPGT